MMMNPQWSKAPLESVGLGFLVHSPQGWLGDRATALSAVSLVSVWQWVGIPTMMFVAAFQSIDDDLLEAASIEGASPWQQFIRIRVPLIVPVIGMVAIMTFVANFNAFDAVFAMETLDGAPDYATDLIGTLFYRYGVAGQHPVGIPEPGLGSAISTTIFAMLLCGVVPVLIKTQGKE
jgi:raffinose/stachyose/melibiose transport system permease protein